MGNDRRNLALCLLISLLLALYLYARTYVISLDGAFQYIPLAKIFLSGSLKEALVSTGQQPLYSAFIALAYQWIPDWERAGKLVASLFGVFLIFPVYFLGRRMFGQKIAFLSTLLLLLHPYLRRFSADVLKESTYLFFLATALWYSWKTLQDDENEYAYLLIPMLAALAYLVRPDGIQILLVVSFYILFLKKFRSPKSKGWAISFLLLSSVLLFLPYLLILREITGEWTLSRTKSISGFLGLAGRGGGIPSMDQVQFAFKKINVEIFSIFHPLYLFLMITGLFHKRFPHLRSSDGFLLLFFILHYITLFLLALFGTSSGREATSPIFHFSGRHVLPLLLFSIYWVGNGMATLSNWLLDQITTPPFFSRWNIKKRKVFCWTILFLMMALILLPKTLKPQRYERLTEKEAGLWMKAQWGSGLTLFTTVPRVAFYAEGKYERIDFEKDSMESIKTSMDEKGIPYLVIRKRESMMEEVGKTLRRDFQELQRFEGKGMEGVILYQKR